MLPDPLIIRVREAYATARNRLLSERNDRGFWEGELSTSPLSTATAVMALEMFRRCLAERRIEIAANLQNLIANGLRWLSEHQNPDGGWGDTTRSISNVSTTMLCHAAFHAAGTINECAATINAAKVYIDRAGGVAAVRARYGKDKTFSIPILTHCALAGLVEWRDVSPLPFELACIPARFYKTVRLPVVSYALPALIAIGQARHHFRPPRNPLTRWIRNAAVGRSLNVLERIQPPNGGFLEATPLTSFVTMSLAAIGLIDHPVTLRGVEFIVHSVRSDGSWPIDTNLATWVTTLSINALGPDLPQDANPPLRDWILSQQFQGVHPYTNADPGGWAWTDLPGGVPDADDTPGAILACLHLESEEFSRDFYRRVNLDPKHVKVDSLLPQILRGENWLRSLQNRDGGWPTFCRGWGTLPFDRSAPDISAHVLRALDAHRKRLAACDCRRDGALLESGFRYLQRAQRPDGSWLPLWFGNQHVPNDENPTYGTTRVLTAYRDCGRIGDPAAVRGLNWLRAAQNADAGRSFQY
jgi:squalene-hopene/tetraprenyl-beta-curcumene cyclase